MISSGSLMRATPPWARMSAGTRSNAITADAPASSAMRACSAFTTSQMTPPLSISGKIRLTSIVPVCFCIANNLLANELAYECNFCTVLWTFYHAGMGGCYSQVRVEVPAMRIASFCRVTARATPTTYNPLIHRNRIGSMYLLCPMYFSYLYIYQQV